MHYKCSYLKSVTDGQTDDTGADCVSAKYYKQSSKEDKQITNSLQTDSQPPVMRIKYTVTFIL